MILALGLRVWDGLLGWAAKNVILTISSPGKTRKGDLAGGEVRENWLCPIVTKVYRPFIFFKVASSHFHF